MIFIKKSDYRHLMRDSARLYFSPIVAVFNELRGDTRRPKHFTIYASGGATDDGNINNVTSYEGKVWQVKSKSLTTLGQPCVERD